MRVERRHGERRRLTSPLDLSWGQSLVGRAVPLNLRMDVDPSASPRRRILTPGPLAGSRALLRPTLMDHSIREPSSVGGARLRDIDPRARRASWA